MRKEKIEPMTDQPVYRDAARPVAERVEDLLSQMNLDEKLAQIGCVWSNALLDDSTFVPAKANQHIPHGIGQITRLAGATSLHPDESAAVLNDLQRYLMEETRLGIPTIVHEESCAGYLSRDATVFPQAIGLAATWEPELVQAMTEIIKGQMMAVGSRHTLAPVLDVARDARWGRCEETFGEDPYLISQMGIAYVRGLQGDDIKDGVAATGKHFTGYAVTEGGMNWSPGHMTARELREVYAAPFEAVIKEANLATVMNGYHEMDGIPCGASKALLVDLLRGELGFDGVIVSDYFTVENLNSYHRVAQDKGEAARMALEATMDLELPIKDCYDAPLKAAVEAGQVDVALVDAAVRNVLRWKFELGLFENPYVDASTAAAVFDTAEDRALARKLAQKSMVLLKNTDDLLPLVKDDLDAIAVIGPSADSIRLLQGDYHYPSHLHVLSMVSEDGESAVPTPGQEVGESKFGADHFVKHVTVLEGITNAVNPEVTVRYAQGCDISGSDTSGFAEAVAIAEAADVAIVVVGGKSGLTPDCTSGEARDRATLGLPGVQQQLVEAIQATGIPVVVVLINGRPLALPWIADNVPAVVEAWLPAEEGGNAVADILFGEVNPGGKLPITLPRSVGQAPIFYGHKPSGGRSHWLGDYVEESTKPLYPFGHGLSYTTFDFANLQIDKAEAEAVDTVTITCDITNTGSRTGEEVVQLYVNDEIASATRPVKELKGFKRVELAPGATKTISFALKASQLGFFNVAMDYVVEPGAIKIMVGSSSEDIRLEGAFAITGDVTDVSGDKVYITPVTVS